MAATSKRKGNEPNTLADYRNVFCWSYGNPDFELLFIPISLSHGIK